MAYNDIAFYHLVRLCFLLVFHDCPNNVCYVMKPSRGYKYFNKRL